MVTGGASGIGEAVAKIHAASACTMLIVDVNGERLRQVEADIKDRHGTCAARCADVTEEEQVIGFLHDAVARWGKLDILVNSAGRDSLAPPIRGPGHCPYRASKHGMRGSARISSSRE